MIPFSLILTLGFPITAYGAEWTIDPSLSAGGEYHDNLTLQPTEKVAVWGSTVVPTLKFQYATEIVKILLDSSVHFVNYFGDKNNNESFTNVYLPLSVDYTGEKDQLGFSAGFIRDNTLQSELEETGIVVNFQQRSNITGRVYWDHDLSERFTLNIGYAFSDVTYENDAERFGLFNYRLHSGSLGGTYEYDEKTKIFNGVDYVNTQAPGAQYFAQNIGLKLGVVREFSETFTGSFSAQGQYVISSSAGESSKDLVWLLDGLVSKSWERTSLTADVSRSLSPSGRGVQLDTNRARITWQHKATDRLSVQVGANVLLSETAGSSSTSNQIRKSFFWWTNASVSWRLTERWSTHLSYNHRQRKSQGSDTAVGNIVSLRLIYDWPGFSIFSSPESLISRR